MTDAILFFIFVVIFIRDFIDNSALRDCARQLKRLADAVEAPNGSHERAAEVATPLGRIANVLERIEENHRQ